MIIHTFTKLSTQVKMGQKKTGTSNEIKICNMENYLPKLILLFAQNDNE